MLFYAAAVADARRITQSLALSARPHAPVRHPAPARLARGGRSARRRG
jgi:hypothetical protein